MDKAHLARCNRLIPTIVKAFPEWDLLVHIPEERWTYEGFSCRDSADPLVRFVVIEVVEGSEDASDEEFRDRCVELVENIIGDLRAVSDAIGNFEMEG